MISSEQDHQSICIHQPGPEPPASASQQTLPPEQFINVEVILLEWYTYMWHTYYWNDCCWNNVPQICILHTVQIWASDILYMCMFFHVFHICAARRKICILALRTINLAWGHCMTSVLRNTIRKARRQRLLFLAFPANTKESRWLSDASSDIGPGEPQIKHWESQRGRPITPSVIRQHSIKTCVQPSCFFDFFFFSFAFPQWFGWHGISTEGSNV